MILWYNGFQLKTKVPHGGNHRDTVNLYRRLTLNTIPQTFICSKCRKEKSIDCFYKVSSYPRGVDYYCKDCRRFQVCDSAKNNRESINKRKRKRYQEDIDRQRAYNLMNYKRWSERNKEHLLEYQRQWQKNNRERINAYRRKSYEKNPKRISFIANKRKHWQRTNGGSGYTYRQWRELCKEYNFTCLACGKSEPEINLSQDHVVPLSQGGKHDIKNIQPLCNSCNASKGTKIIDYR